MHCNKCQGNVEDFLSFCRNCGYPLHLNREELLHWFNGCELGSFHFEVRMKYLAERLNVSEERVRILMERGIDPG